jgi:hypothetical protein
MVGRWLVVYGVLCHNISVISWQSVLLVEETGGPNMKVTMAISMLRNFITKGKKIFTSI